VHLLTHTAQLAVRTPMPRILPQIQQRKKTLHLGGVNGSFPVIYRYSINILKIEGARLEERLALSLIFSPLDTEIAFPLIID
jgi:hypothetical protein